MNPYLDVGLPVVIVVLFLVAVLVYVKHPKLTTAVKKIESEVSAAVVTIEAAVQTEVTKYETSLRTQIASAAAKVAATAVKAG